LVTIPGFEFATATRIVFGAGKARELPTAARLFGRRPLVATGSSPERHARLIRGFDSAVTFAVTGEPTLALVRDGVQLALSAGCDFVVAIGGGSAIDAGKAIAVLAPNSGEPLNYLEVIGQARPIARDPLPFVAVPTTAGTGSEATRNAVLGSPEHRVKASLRDARMLPRLAVVDPELALGLPPAITAATGLDALTQLIEAYTCCRANPMTDALCLEGIRLAAGALRRVYTNGQDLAARTEMSLASLFSGIALANAGLGAVHGFAAAIGGIFPAPHGAVCATLLPHVMDANLKALRKRAPDSDALRRYHVLARLLTGNPQADATDGASWVRQLAADLQIPPLRRYGLTNEHLPELVSKAAQASSMKANPLPLTSGELQNILLSAL
jgi:alcohol dehydrogenase class IV